MIRSFSAAESHLSGGKSKDNRPLENNTRLIRLNNDEIAVRLHATDVVTYRRNGEIVLNSGGWRTVTTKDRINKYAPVTVYSSVGVWYVNPESIGTSLTARSVFYDGITVNEDGQLVSEARTTNLNTLDKELKRINKYVSGFIEQLKNGMSVPGKGDCWDCLFVDRKSRKSWGDMIGYDDKDNHLTSHIKEKYYVPSLLVNALVEKGYRYPEIIAHIEGDRMGGPHFMVDSCRRALREYLKRRLMPENSGSKPV